jgi:hypothetical protein
MTAAQCELLCDREGLEVVHRGWGRLELVQTSAHRRPMLRIALTPDRRAPRGTEPEAA